MNSSGQSTCIIRLFLYLTLSSPDIPLLDRGIDWFGEIQVVCLQSGLALQKLFYSAKGIELHGITTSISLATLIEDNLMIK